MRVAIVHYWFLVYGGGERVVEALASMYPDADIFALFANRSLVPPNIRRRRIKTSFLNGLPFATKVNRTVFPFYPLGIESFDLRKYDLVLTSDSPPMKGVITNRNQLHICYCHTPGRYLWDSYGQFRDSLPWIARPAFSIAADYVRKWDFRAAQRVSKFVANSHYVAGRIRRYYNRESTVIYPPVETRGGYLSDKVDTYYLHVGRLVSNKRVDLLIEACNRLNRRLLVAGTGRDEKYLKSLAGSKIEFLGRVPDESLPELYAKCRGLLFAANEDFGIVPLEAQSYGRPVIAFGKGGSLESILPYGQHEAPTGLFFEEQSVDAVSNAILRFESVQHEFRPCKIQDHARRFDTTVFSDKMGTLISQAAAQFRAAI